MDIKTTILEIEEKIAETLEKIAKEHPEWNLSLYIIALSDVLCEIVVESTAISHETFIEMMNFHHQNALEIFKKERKEDQNRTKESI